RSATATAFTASDPPAAPAAFRSRADPRASGTCLLPETLSTPEPPATEQQPLAPARTSRASSVRAAREGLSRREAAVGDELRAGAVGALVGGEEEGESRDLLGLGGAAERDAALPVAVERRARRRNSGGVAHAGVDEARVERVHADPERRE